MQSLHRAWMVFAVETLLQAVKDADYQEYREEVREFAKSQHCMLLCELAGRDYEQFKETMLRQTIVRRRYGTRWSVYRWGKLIAENQTLKQAAKVMGIRPANVYYHEYPYHGEYMVKPEPEVVTKKKIRYKNVRHWEIYQWGKLIDTVTSPGDAAQIMGIDKDYLYEVAKRQRVTRDGFTCRFVTRKTRVES